jgi:hypothetical protein
VAFRDDAGREVPDLGSQIWCFPVLVLCFLELRRSELYGKWRRETEISINKAAFRGSGGKGCTGTLLLPVRHGGEWGEELLPAASSRPPLLQQGSRFASHQRSITAPLSPYFLAVGRPPPIGEPLCSRLRSYSPEDSSRRPAPPRLCIPWSKGDPPYPHFFFRFAWTTLLHARAPVEAHL